MTEIQNWNRLTGMISCQTPTKETITQATRFSH